jgi:low affinity Fe/Cu permease
MTLFIQRAETRDTLAIHAKLDEVLRAEQRARNELTNLDEQEPEEIERHRAKQRNPCECRLPLPAGLVESSRRRGWIKKLQ